MHRMSSPFTTPYDLDPTSDARVGTMVAQIRRFQAGGYYASIAADRFSVPIFEVPAEQPLVPVTLDNSAPYVAPLRAAFAAGVPIPEHAAPAAGTDAHMVIRQGEQMWEGWHWSKQADGWHVGWGGAEQSVSSNPGHFTCYSWPGLAPNHGWDWGARATSIPLMAGVPRLSDLRRGFIPHAICAAVYGALRGMWAWPAQRSDGWNTDPNAMPEGAHLVLDPALDIGALGLPHLTAMLAHAAQRFGIIVTDQTRSPFSLFAEAPPPGEPSPYTGPGGLYEGLAPWRMLKDFPWESLRLRRMYVCTRRPCLPPALAALRPPLEGSA